MLWIFLLQLWMIMSLVLRWTPACSKSTIQDLEKVNNVMRVYSIPALLCLTKKLTRKQKLPRLWNSEKVKTSSQFCQQLRNSRKNILLQKKFQMTKYHNPMILELLEGMISPMVIEIRKLADLATLSDLSKQSNQGWSLSMVKMSQISQCSKFLTATIWLRDVPEDGHILMPTSWNMLIWWLKNALHIPLQQKVTHVEITPSANQRPKFKTPNSLEEVLPKCQNCKWWKT